MSGTEDQLINQHIPLVRRLAAQMVARLPANIDLNDLMQAGLVGLLDALRRYQYNPDAQFETYATTRIRGAMLDELRSQDWLPRSVRSKARQIEHAITALNHRLMRPASDAEIAAEMKVSLDDYHQLLDDAHGTQIMHYEDFGHNRGDQGHPLDYTLATEHNENENNPFANLVSRGMRNALIKAIQGLPEREQLLLSMQFEQDLTQKEIAAVMNITEGRVSQIRSQAVVRIRAALAESGWHEKPEELDYQALL